MMPKADENPEFDEFRNLTKRLLEVEKQDLDQAIKQEQSEKDARPISKSRSREQESDA